MQNPAINEPSVGSNQKRVEFEIETGKFVYPDS